MIVCVISVGIIYIWTCVRVHLLFGLIFSILCSFFLAVQNTCLVLKSKWSLIYWLPNRLMDLIHIWILESLQGQFWNLNIKQKSLSPLPHTIYPLHLVHFRSLSHMLELLHNLSQPNWLANSLLVVFLSPFKNPIALQSLVGVWFCKGF